MTPTDHRPTPRRRPLGVCRSAVLGLLLAGSLTLASASGALAFTFPYTFTPITGSPFSEQYFPQHVLFSPNGGLLATDSVYGFTVQTVSTSGSVSTTGTSENAFTCPSKGKPAERNTSDSIAISPDGKVIAEVEELGTHKGTLRTYLVSTSGSLTPKQCLTDIGNAPQGEIPGGGIYSDAFSPASEGGLLAVTDADENKLWVFTVTGAGKVHPLKGFPVYTGKQPRSVAFSPDGSSFDFLAIANAAENSVSMFTVGSGVVAPVRRIAVRDRHIPDGGSVQPERRPARDRRLSERRGVDVLGGLHGQADEGLGIAARAWPSTVIGCLQPRRHPARDAPISTAPSATPEATSCRCSRSPQGERSHRSRTPR